jgi:hypothetical protein
VDATERERLIERYAAGYAAVAAALDGIADHEWEAREAPGEWCPREVVHHLADSEMTSAIRLRKLVAEDGPELQNYDEAEWARRLHYDRPVDGSLAAFRAARESTVPLLRALTEAEWAREGTHTASGRYRVEDWLRIYAAHAHDHADQIRRARGGAR